MSALSGLVRKELRRYSIALGNALASFETRPPVQTTDEFASFLAEVHTLFEDDFLDRLEPSGWIQPLFELALVPQSAKLMSFILSTHQEVKEDGLLPAINKPHSDHEDYDPAQPRPCVLTQLVAVEACQAAFPIQWAAQAIQLEAAGKQPTSQRLGPQLLRQLTSEEALDAMVAAARLVLDDLWKTPTPESLTAASTKPAAAPSTSAIALNSATAAAAISFDGAVAIIHATLRRGKSSGPTNGRSTSAGSGGLFRRPQPASETSVPSAAGSTALAGARLLSVVVNYISAVLAAAVHEQSASPRAAGEGVAPTSGGDEAAEDSDVPSAQQLLTALRTSGVLSALCAAVVSAPPCPPPTATAAAEVLDDYTHVMSEVHLTLFMILWDLSALLAAPYGTAAADLLADPNVVQLRRTALTQVAASASFAAADGGPLCGDAEGTGAFGALAHVTRYGSSSGGGAASTAASTCWPLLRDQAVRRIYAARGLHFSDVVHIMVDAAVGAIVVPQDLGSSGAAAAATAAQQLFPSHLEGIELGSKVCQALCSHSDRLARHQAKAARAAKTGLGPLAALGGLATGRGLGGAEITQRHLNDLQRTLQKQRQYQQQREQLADDAASVEDAVRVRLASAEEKQACRAHLEAIRKWVQQAAAPAEVERIGEEGEEEAEDVLGVCAGVVSMTLAGNSPAKHMASARRREGCTPRDAVAAAAMESSSATSSPNCSGSPIPGQAPATANSPAGSCAGPAAAAPPVISPSGGQPAAVPAATAAAASPGAASSAASCSVDPSPRTDAATSPTRPQCPDSPAHQEQQPPSTAAQASGPDGTPCGASDGKANPASEPGTPQCAESPTGLPAEGHSQQRQEQPQSQERVQVEGQGRSKKKLLPSGLRRSIGKFKRWIEERGA